MVVVLGIKIISLVFKLCSNKILTENSIPEEDSGKVTVQLRSTRTVSLHKDNNSTGRPCLKSLFQNSGVY
jgi:hypothetical protein